MTKLSAFVVANKRAVVFSVLQNASRASRRQYQITYSSETNYRMLISIYEQAIAEASS